MPKIIEKSLDNNKKIYTTEDLRVCGYSKYIVDQMVEDGTLEKLSCSVFENPNYEGPESDLYYVPALIPGGVVCIMSAAVYYGLTTYWPSSIDVAVKKDKRIANIPAYPNMQFYHFGGNRYELGRTVVVEGANSFAIYDIEKTVADILYFRNQVGIEETKEILRNYLERKDRNLPKLHEYAASLRCEKILRTYLEVLI